MNRYVRLLVLGVVIALCFATASLAETIDLDEIGVRYTSGEGELCATRVQQPDEALTLLGVDRDTLLVSMEGDGAYLVALLPGGQQLTLCVEPRPEELTQTDVNALDLSAKQQFLSAVARKENFGQAVWCNDAPGFAMFTQLLDGADSPFPFETAALSTLYLGDILTLRMDVIGRELTDDDTALLIGAAKRLLLLGARTTEEAAAAPVALTLPAQQPLTESKAQWTTVKNELPLTVNDVPAIVGTTEMPLSGTTQAKASMRYILNGKPSSRFKADENGSFSVVVKELSEGDNELELISFVDKQQTELKCNVTLNWQTTPLALSTTEAVTVDGVATLEGLTLPGAKVTLIRKTSSTVVKVDDTGAFTCTIKLKNTDKMSLSIRALADGYKRIDVPVTVTKPVSDEDRLASLRKKAKTIKYTKLAQKPSAYKDKLVELTGVLSELTNANGQVRLTLTTAEGDAYVVLCDDLLAVHDGETRTLYGTLTGETAAAARGELPSLSLELLTK